MTKNLGYRLGFLAVAVLILIAAAVYFWPKKPAPQSPAPQTTTQSTPQSTQPPSVQLPPSPKVSFHSATGTWREYSNENLGLSFQLPEKWNVDDKQDKNLVIVDNVELISGDYVGGIPDGWIKVDIQDSPKATLDSLIDCAQKVEGLYRCEEVKINGTTFRLRAVASEIEGAHKELMVATKSKDGVLFAVGFAPQGSNQENAMQIIEKIFRTLKLN